MLVAVVGKGGVGKTSVAALLVRRWLEARATPVLAIDADPSSCLGAALGVEVAGTLAEVRDAMRDSPERPPSMSPGEYLELRMNELLVERAGWDLLTMGHPEGKGCYCFVNNLVRDHLDRLARSYRNVVLDCEAGLEHLSRRTAGRPDVLVCVAGRARMAAETVRRALSLYRELHGEWPRRAELVLNGFEPGEPAALGAREIAGAAGASFARVLHVPYDPSVAAAEASGRSLLELEASAPAYAALRDWELGA
jgi:CO dehydrogenase maturation factor